MGEGAGGRDEKRITLTHPLLYVVAVQVVYLE